MAWEKDSLDRRIAQTRFMQLRTFHHSFYEEFDDDPGSLIRQPSRAGQNGHLAFQTLKMQ
jgi:hypothetical protein